VNREILKLALPNIVSNLTVPLIGVVDTALMGHEGTTEHLGAIALGTMIFNFLYWAFGFLRMGTTGLTAQAYGEDNQRETMNLLGRGVLTALTAGLLLFILQTPIMHIAFRLIDGNREVEQLAREYFRIRIYAAPATIGLYVFYGWFMGMQNARYLLTVSVFANSINILASLVLVYGYGMASSGIALGTVIAQSAGLLLAVGLFLKRYRHFLRYLEKRALVKLQAIKRFFAVNFDIFIRTLCLIFTFSFFTAKSAAMGETILAVNQIYLQFIYILAYGIDGFAFASESLVGKYTGRKHKPSLQKAVRYSFYWGMGLAFAVSLIYGFFGPQMLHMFTDKASIYRAALPFLPWLVIAPLLNTPGFIWDGVYIGATQSKPMRNTLLVATFLVFLPVYFIARLKLDNHGLWLAFSAFMVTRGLMLGLYARSSVFNER